VVVGETDSSPENATSPTPESISTESAFETCQLSVVDPPRNTLSGSALKYPISGRVPITTVGGGDEGGGSVAGADATATSVVAVLLPAEFVAVMVYKIVVNGETEVDPERATVPIPGSIVTDSASLTFQLIVVD
jgi:hypothetical protein